MTRTREAPAPGLYGWDEVVALVEATVASLPAAKTTRKLLRALKQKRAVLAERAAYAIAAHAALLYLQEDPRKVFYSPAAQVRRLYLLALAGGWPRLTMVAAIHDVARQALIGTPLVKGWPRTVEGWEHPEPEVEEVVYRRIQRHEPAQTQGPAAGGD